MMRRLFFLLPDNKQAGKLAIDLEHDAGINQQDIHAMARDTIQVEGISDIHGMNDPDTDAELEWWVWRINLAVFFIALLVFITGMAWSPSWWLVIPAAIMAGTFIAGLIYVLRMPQLHIGDFFSALRHGEVLMMVDVKPSRVDTVSKYVHRRHPQAITGGVGWHM